MGLHHVKWTACLFKRSQVLQPGANCARSYVLNFKNKTEILLTLWLSLFLLMLREECDLKKKHTGVCTKKDMNLYFSLPASRKENFSTVCMRDFFLTVCTHGYKLKCTVSYREKEQKPKSSFPTATPSVHPKAFSNMSLLGAKEAACIGL